MSPPAPPRRGRGRDRGRGRGRRLRHHDGFVALAACCAHGRVVEGAYVQRLLISVGKIQMQSIDAMRALRVVIIQERVLRIVYFLGFLVTSVILNEMQKNKYSMYYYKV